MSQAPLRGCRCEPLVRKLENQLQATKEEMKTEVHTVQDVINRKVGQQELRSSRQVSDTQLKRATLRVLREEIHQMRRWCKRSGVNRLLLLCSYRLTDRSECWIR